MKPIARLLLFFLSILSAGDLGAAILRPDAARDIVQFARRTWTMRDGMPQGGILSIAQTPDGFLWLATDQGLARFDGTRFVVYTPATTPQLRAMGVYHLAASTTGTLWIVTDASVVTRRGDEFTERQMPKEFSGISIRAIAPGRDGRIWFATSQGLFAWGEDDSVHGLIPASAFPEKGPLSVIGLDDGSLLVGTVKGVMVVRDGSLTPHPSPLLGKAIVTRFARGPRGEIWMGTPESDLFQLQTDGTCKLIVTKSDLKSDRLWSLAVDRSGSAWVGSSGAMVSRIYDGKVTSMTLREGFRSEGIRALFTDREGNLWAGTSAATLHRFVNGAFVVRAAGTTDADRMTWMIARDPRLGMVVGTESGRVLRWDGEKFRRHPDFAEPLDAPPMAYSANREGRVLVGTTNGLHLRGPARQFFPVGNVSAMMEDEEGIVWIGTSKGLWQYCDQGLQPYGKGKLPPVGIRYILRARGGGLWLGTSGAGLMRLKKEGSGGGCEDVYTLYTKEKGLGSNWVMSMVEDSTDRLWVTTPAGGITLFRNGVLRQLTPADGLPDQVFFTVAEDALGYLWCTSNRGIIRFRKSDLLARVDGTIARVPWTSFGLDDGMVSDECNGGYQASVAVAERGVLWFPTTAGAAVVDPGRALRNVEPPPVVLGEVQIDHETYPGGKSIELPHGRGELEFHYVGLFLSAPERVRYRVQLMGFDADWIEAGTRQSAYYTNIPPGNYTFRVAARVDDGEWSPVEATTSVVLTPRFTQTGWFGLLCVLAVGAAIAGGFALYRRDRERELHSSRLEADLTKTRLQVLEMQLQPHFLFNTLNSIMVLIGKDPPAAQRTMGRLADILRRSLDRSGTQEVTLSEELEFLERYIEIERVRFGDRLTVEKSIPGGTERALVPTMILQPLVENAIRHGVSVQRGPAKITISVSREDGSLVLGVEDNGVGTQGKGLSLLRMGVGLTNTQERLRQLYGERQNLHLESLPGGGMAVRVAIPYHTQGVFA